MSSAASSASPSGLSSSNGGLEVDGHHSARIFEQRKQHQAQLLHEEGAALRLPAQQLPLYLAAGTCSTSGLALTKHAAS